MFDSPNGKVSLADLFNERSQLIVHHFMFSPNSPSNHLDSQDYFYIIYYKGYSLLIGAFCNLIGYFTDTYHCSYKIIVNVI
ncbi:hypothetical protein CN514_04255 [Bacillus sp. AFS001701]|nr:hypothetical protein CN514_04255 [Bacillus sp. AFS001701]